MWLLGLGVFVIAGLCVLLLIDWWEDVDDEEDWNEPR